MKTLTLTLTFAVVSAFTLGSCASKKKAYAPPPAPEVVVAK